MLPRATGPNNGTAGDSNTQRDSTSEGKTMNLVWDTLSLTYLSYLLKLANVCLLSYQLLYVL